MYRHASSGATLYDAVSLDPDDAALIDRWDAAGRPPVPLVTDPDGWVTVCARDVPGLFARRGLHWAVIRHVAARWIDRHCP